MSEDEIKIKYTYELLWMVGEISSNKFLYQGLKCSSSCEKCKDYPCEKFKNFSRPNHPLRQSTERFYPTESLYRCSFDLLPSIVIDRIFNYCKQRDLMKLSRAFPQYTCLKITIKESHLHASI